MADAVYYLAQRDGGHETVEAMPDTHGEAHADVAAPGDGHDGGDAGPFKSEPNLTIYTGLAFVLVLIGLTRIVPSILRVLDERSEKIAGDLQAADDAKGEAEKLQAQFEQQLADARAEGRKILDAARQQAEGQAREILAAAQAEAAALKQRTQEEIESEKARAVKDLRSQIGDLSCAVASRLIHETVSADTHRGLIDKFIDELSNGDGRRN